MNEKKKDKAAEKHGSRFYRTVYALLSGLVGFFLNIKVVNPQKEPDATGYIICPNHSAGIDPIAISYAFRKNQVYFMAKKELFRVPIFGWCIKLFGAFPVDRSGSDVGAVKKAISVVEQNKCMGIFPQGHRYKGENPRDTKTKNGVALIATKTHADILPCFIWRKGNRSGLFRRTYIIFGDMIPFESLGYDPDASGEYARITDIVFDKICTLGEEFERERNEKKKKDSAK